MTPLREYFDFHNIGPYERSQVYVMIRHLETHQLGRKLRKPFLLPLPMSVLDGDVLSFYVATLAQS
jgi:hypothetical protein